MNNSVLHYWSLVFLIGQSQSEVPLRGVSSGRLLGKGSARSSASTGRRSKIRMLGDWLVVSQVFDRTTTSRSGLRCTATAGDNREANQGDRSPFARAFASRSSSSSASIPVYPR